MYVSKENSTLIVVFQDFGISILFYEIVICLKKLPALKNERLDCSSIGQTIEGAKSKQSLTNRWSYSEPLPGAHAGELPRGFYLLCGSPRAPATPPATPPSSRCRTAAQRLLPLGNTSPLREAAPTPSRAPSGIAPTGVSPA